MKVLFSLLVLFVSVVGYGQVPQPKLLSLMEYTGNGVDAVLSNVTKTKDGGFIICITSTSTSAGGGNIDSFCILTKWENIFMKFDAAGEHVEWTKCTDLGGFIYPQDDGSFIYGVSTNAVPSGWAYKISKEDAAGALLWTKLYGAQQASAILRDMISTADGGYLMAGETNYSDTDFTTHHGSFADADIAVIKVDSNGDKVWARVYGGTGEDWVAGVISAPGGGAYIVGTTQSNDGDLIGNHGNSDAYVIRLDAMGNVVWHRDLGGTEYDAGGGTTACEDGKGGLLIATSVASNDGDVSHAIPGVGRSMWLVNIDGNNVIRWDNCYGGGGYEYPNAICRATDNSIWMTGVSKYKGGQVDTSYTHQDIWVVHTDNSGIFLGSKVLGSTGQDEGYMIYPLSNNNIITGGIYEYGNGSFDVSNGNDEAYIAWFSNANVGVDPSPISVQNVLIYPNPTKGNLIVEVKKEGNYLLEIYAPTGVKLNTVHFSEKKVINVGEMSSGIYFVRITDDDGNVETNKLVIQN